MHKKEQTVQTTMRTTILTVFLVAFHVVLTAVLLESPTARHQLLHMFRSAKDMINDALANYEPWQIVALSIGSTLLIYQLVDYAFSGRESFTKRIKRTWFNFIRSLPIIRTEIAKQLNKARGDLEKEVLKHYNTTCMPNHHKLPAKGYTHHEIISKLDNIDSGTKGLDWRGGKVSGCAYNCSEDLTKLTNEVYGRYSWTNPLHVGVFPEIRKMEAEVVSCCVNLFNGGPDACGCMTSGGTESILMAMRAYRELGYSRGIQYPEIIGSTATHAAFIKAADYFCMKFVPVDCDPLTRMVDLKKMKRAINKNTIVLVGNAPQYPYGVIDPIEDIAKIGLKYNIGVHVDCCLGGFILPFMDKAGYPIDPFDFRVKGVTSISADTHKYGYSPKGSSVVMYANADLRRRQFFVATDSEMGIYPSPSVAGSRPGGIIAATWASLMYMGEETYIKNTRKIVATARHLAEEINKIPGLRVIGEPLACALGFTSDQFDIYRLNASLSHKGWELSPLQFPPALHVAVTMLHTEEIVEALLADIRSCTEEILSKPNEKLSDIAAFYGTSQAISDRSIITEVASMFMEVYYATEPSSNKQ